MWRGREAAPWAAPVPRSMDTFDAHELARWSAGSWTGPRPGNVSGFCIDSRVVQPGDLFVALPGDKADGHAYLPQAHTRGASAALVRRGTPPCGLPLLEVEDPRRALRDLAAGYRALLKARFVAVTGSSGKTTVKEMIADVLATQAPTARTKGNWNNDLGLPLSLLAMSRRDVYGVFEVGMNHPGELEPLCELLRPHCSVVTSVGPVHIQSFPDEAGIAHEKAAVLRALAPEGLAVLPADDPWVDVLRSHLRSRLLLTSLKGQPADYEATTRPGDRFLVRERATGAQVELAAPLPGDYIVHDALLAVAVGRYFGVSWDGIRAAVAAYRPLSLRWQREEADGVLFIVDAYNANPMSMRAALQAFGQTAAARRWLVLAGMRELGERAREEHLRLGRALAGGPWAGLVTVGDEGAWIAEGAAPFLSVVLRCADACEAAERLRERVRPGDAVLLKASRGEKLEQVWTEWKRKGSGSPAG